MDIDRSGISRSGISRAYALQVLHDCEILNVHIGRPAIVVTAYPLCGKRLKSISHEHNGENKLTPAGGRAG